MTRTRSTSAALAALALLTAGAGLPGCRSDNAGGADAPTSERPLGSVGSSSPSVRSGAGEFDAEAEGR